MSLDVIGAGFGRTATLSLNAALERLGFGPCYHMVEVIKHRGRPKAWLRRASSLIDGLLEMTERIVWNGVFEGRFEDAQRAQQIFDEQKFRLMYTPEREADVLRVGQLAGATQVIFVEVQLKPSGGPEIKSASVGIRSVSVETGQVRWSGTARVMTTDWYVIQGDPVGALAEMAMRRATCPVETGRFEWNEQSESDYVGGCRQRRP